MAEQTQVLCECGCGQIAPLAKRTRPEWGHVKGQPLRFINGHNRRRFDQTAEGFWSRVDQSGGQDACWPWMGPQTEFGHGLLYWHGDTVGAHRLAYELHHGTEPGEMWVRHDCDNPSCCNPAHLRLGTSQDNTADRQRRQRQSRGASRWCAKLTESRVIEARRRHASGETFAAIAADFGVRYQSIARAIRGKTWSHVK